MKVLMGKVCDLLNTYSSEKEKQKEIESEVSLTNDGFWTEEVIKAVEAIEMAQKKRVERQTFTQYEKLSFRLLFQESNASPITAEQREHENAGTDAVDHEVQINENQRIVNEQQENVNEQQKNFEEQNDQSSPEDETRVHESSSTSDEMTDKDSEKGKNICMEGEDGEENVLKRKRNVMPAAAIKSPFVNRVTEIKAPPTTEEIKVAQFVFSEGTDKNDVLYKVGDVTLSKSELESLNISCKVNSRLIDVWAMILNNNETLRSDETRKRLIFTTTPCRVLEENKLTAPTTRSKRFFDATRAQFAKMALPKVRNMNLFIFPVEQSGRSYMMTFDLKYNKFFIIDICDAEIYIKMKYLSQPNHLKSDVLK